MASDSDARKRKKSSLGKRNSRSASPAFSQKKSLKRVSCTDEESDEEVPLYAKRTSLMHNRSRDVSSAYHDEADDEPRGSQDNVPCEQNVRQNNRSSTPHSRDFESIGDSTDDNNDAHGSQGTGSSMAALQEATNNHNETQITDNKAGSVNGKCGSTSTEASTTKRTNKENEEAGTYDDAENAIADGTISQTPADNVLSSAVISAVRDAATRGPCQFVKRYEISKNTIPKNHDYDTTKAGGSPMQVRVTKFKKLDSTEVIREALEADQLLSCEIEKIEKDWMNINRRFADWMQRGHEMIIRQSSCRLAVQLRQVEQEEKLCLTEMQRLKTFQRAMKDAWQSINNADICH